MKNLSLMKQVYENIMKDDNRLNISVILEIGSRDGDDSNYMKEKFNLRDEDVYIVEPNNISYNLIKEKYPNYKVYKYAINEYNGECDFYNIMDKNVIGISSVKNRRDKYYDNISCNKIRVKCITGHDLINDINKRIDYCQIDVEGLGYEVLTSIKEHIKKINYILIESEYKEIWEDQKMYKDIDEYMRKTHELIFIEKVGAQSNTLWKLRN